MPMTDAVPLRQRLLSIDALRGLVILFMLLDHVRKDPVDNPLQPMLAALEGGDSLILFPEGTRWGAARTTSCGACRWCTRCPTRR